MRAARLIALIMLGALPHHEAIGGARFADSPCKAAYEYHFLNRAAALGDIVGAQLLLEGGADPSGSGYETALSCNLIGEFSSPLMVAVMNGDKEMADLLLKHGGDPNLKEAESISSTDMARRRGDSQMLELLVEHGGR
jgi:hypothetical protein